MQTAICTVLATDSLRNALRVMFAACSSLPQYSVNTAVQMMRNLGVRRVPVVESDKLIGIVSLTDVFQRAATALLNDRSVEAKPTHTSHPMSNISRDTNELLFIGTRGHVIAIRKSDGETVWSRSLPKTGYSVVAIVPEDGVLLCGSGGHAFALDPSDGRILWANNLKGMGNGITYLATMQSNSGSGMASLAGQAAADAAAAASAAT